MTQVQDFLSTIFSLAEFCRKMVMSWGKEKCHLPNPSVQAVYYMEIPRVLISDTLVLGCHFHVWKDEKDTRVVLKVVIGVSKRNHQGGWLLFRLNVREKLKCCLLSYWYGHGLFFSVCVSLKMVEVQGTEHRISIKDFS